MASASKGYVGEGKNGDFCVLSGSANPDIAAEVAEHLGVALTPVNVKRFADLEISITIGQNVREKTCFLVQGTCPPANDHIMELLLTCDALRRSSAARVVAVVPYYGYARQDRKEKARVPISAAAVASMMEGVGVDRVICVDLHCGQIQGFFNCPLDNLYGSVVLVNYFATERFRSEERVCVVSPDAGGAKRAEVFREYLEMVGVHASFALLSKTRKAANEVSSMELVGDVEGCCCIIIDDIVDTAGTLVLAAEKLQEAGAKTVVACMSHGLFSGPAIQRLQDSCISELVVLNTIPLPEEKKIDKIKVLSTGPLIAQCIDRIVQGGSVSDLFDRPAT